MRHSDKGDVSTGYSYFHFTFAICNLYNSGTYNHSITLSSNLYLCLLILPSLTLMDITMYHIPFSGNPRKLWSPPQCHSTWTILSLNSLMNFANRSQPSFFLIALKNEVALQLVYLLYFSSTLWHIPNRSTQNKFVRVFLGRPVQLPKLPGVFCFPASNNSPPNFTYHLHQFFLLHPTFISP